MGTYIIVLLTTIYVSSTGSQEIHVYKEPTVAACQKAAEEWDLSQAYSSAKTAPAFRFGYSVSCGEYVVGPHKDA